MLRLLAWIKYADERPGLPAACRRTTSRSCGCLTIISGSICGSNWVCRMSGGLRKPAHGRRRWRCLPITSRAAEIWWQQNQGNKLAAYPKLTIWYLDDAQLAQLSAFADRTMTLQATLQDGSIWLSDAPNNLEIHLTSWHAPA